VIFLITLFLRDFSLNWINLFQTLTSFFPMESKWKWKPSIENIYFELFFIFSNPLKLEKKSYPYFSKKTRAFYHYFILLFIWPDFVLLTRPKKASFQTIFLQQNLHQKFLKNKRKFFLKKYLLITWRSVEKFFSQTFF